ncbi:MAG: DUF92 domain-containing protein, partial [Candidatus Thermoplasmatota archaeon]|nr:DUF92 domain-containing protein [Candidatus Thermoplasmatota archaeon]
MATNPLSDPVAAFEVLAVAGLAVAANRKRLLNASGAFAAFLVGTTIIVTTNIFWLILLMSLLVLAGVATRAQYKKKAARGTEEARGGVRRTRNVLANGLAPTLIALFHGPIDSLLEPGASSLLFIGAVAAAAADTFASEFGGLSKKVVLITSFQRVPPGTDGGISWTGQVAAFAGAMIISALGIVLLGSLPFTASIEPTPAAFTAGNLVASTVAGFLGCQADSFLGATLEVRGRLTKEEVN